MSMDKHSFIFCENSIDYYPLYRLSVLNPSSQFDIQNYSLYKVKPHLYGDNGVFKSEKVIILANNVCNLKCVYCYAAQGHDITTPVLKLDQIETFIDFIIKTQKEKRDTRLKVVFLGGGEPFMSLSLIREAVNYIHKKTQSEGLERTIEIVTNGTFINDDIIKWLKEFDIRLDVSFEILEDIQQAQRGQYNRVHKALQLLDKEGIIYKTRTVITPLNVSKMKEMIHISKDFYPNNKEVRMELVSSDTNSELFFEEFVKNYFAAKDVADQYDIKINNSKINAFNYLRDYHCYPELALTPEGKVSVCHRYSNTNNPLYEKFSLGKVESIEMMDVQKIRNTYDCKMKTCNKCIAQYHCGGGCVYNNIMLPHQRKDYCKMMILAVKLQILQKLTPNLYSSFINSPMTYNEFSKNTHIPLKEKIAFYPLSNQ